MNGLFAAILLTTALPMSAMAQEAPQNSAKDPPIDNAGDVAAIRAIIVAMTAAQTGEEFGKAFADDVIYYDLMEDSAFGKEQFLRHIAHQFAPLRNIRTKILDLHIHTDGRFGYAVSTQNFLSDTVAGGKVDQIFRETDVLEKRDGHWVIVHQHLSMPFRLADDFQTATTLLNSTATLPGGK